MESKKHDLAIALVKEDLIKLKDYIIIYQLKGVYLMDSAYGKTTSIRALQSGNVHSDDSKMLRDLIRNEEILHFIERYEMLIDRLPPMNQKIINQYVSADYTNRWNKFIWEGYRLNKNQYYKAWNTSLELLAIYNPEIEYDASDFISYKSVQASKKKKIKPTTLVKKIIEYSQFNDSVWQMSMIEQLPEEYLVAIKKHLSHDFINESERTSMQRGLLILCYWHPYIPMTDEELQASLKRTGHGWKKAHNKAKHQDTLFKYI